MTMTSKFNRLHETFNNCKLLLSLKLKPITSFFERMYRIKNLFKIIFALMLTSSSLSYGYFKYEKNQKDSMLKAIKNNQAVMVNLETKKVFSGSYYKEKVEVPVQYVSAEPLKNVITKVPKSESIEFRKYTLKDEDKNKAKVVLVFTNLGLNKLDTGAALELSNKITLGFSPYAQDIKELVENARNKGFEVLMNIPMQPNDYPVNDFGPHVLLNNLATAENLSRLDSVIFCSDRIVGTSMPNESFFNSQSNMSIVLEELKKNKLIFSYGNISKRYDIEETARLSNIKLAPADLIIDENLNQDKIISNLSKLERIAQKNGFAVGYVSLSRLSIDIVKTWMKQLDCKKTIVVSISNLFENLKAFHTITKNNNNTDSADATNADSVEHVTEATLPKLHETAKPDLNAKTDLNMKADLSTKPDLKIETDLNVKLDLNAKTDLQETTSLKKTNIQEKSELKDKPASKETTKNVPKIKYTPF